jgi:hypothetical protein
MCVRHSATVRPSVGVAKVERRRCRDLRPAAIASSTAATVRFEQPETADGGPVVVAGHSRP